MVAPVWLKLRECALFIERACTMAEQSPAESLCEPVDTQTKRSPGKRAGEPMDPQAKRRCQYCTKEDDEVTEEFRRMLEKRTKEDDEVREKSAYDRGWVEFKTHANWVAQVLRIVQAAGDPNEARWQVQRFTARTGWVRAPGAGGFEECTVEERKMLMKTRFREEPFHRFGAIPEAKMLSRTLIVPYIECNKATERPAPEHKSSEQTIEKWKSSHFCVYCTCDPKVAMQIEEMKAKKAREREFMRQKALERAVAEDAEDSEAMRRITIERAKAELQDSASFVTQLLRIIQCAPHQLEARARATCFIRRAREAYHPTLWFAQCAEDDQKTLLQDIPEQSFYTFDDLPEGQTLDRKRVVPRYILRLQKEQRQSVDERPCEEDSEA